MDGSSAKNRRIMWSFCGHVLWVWVRAIPCAVLYDGPLLGAGAGWVVTLHAFSRSHMPLPPLLSRWFCLYHQVNRGGRGVRVSVGHDVVMNRVEGRADVLRALHQILLVWV